MKDKYNDTMERVKDVILYKKPLHKRKQFINLNQVIKISKM